MSFEKEFEQERLSVKKALEETVKVAAIELFSGIIYRTPVGNKSLWKNPNANPDYSGGGSARSNWFLSFSVPSGKVTDSTEREAGNRSSFYGEIASEIGNKTSQTYVLSNNLPYIERLNENWSTQTQGFGIVAPEQSRVQALIPKIEKAASKRYGVS
ncbi:putative neck protein [Vibrio phage 242E40-1]|nr:putative neck protein [Vibrio phage 242E40-1]